MISVIGIEKNWSQIISLCFIYGDKILISSTLHTPELSVDIKPTGNSGQLAKPVQINLLGNSDELAKPVQINLLGKCLRWLCRWWPCTGRHWRWTRSRSRSSFRCSCRRSSEWLKKIFKNSWHVHLNNSTNLLVQKWFQRFNINTAIM